MHMITGFGKSPNRDTILAGIGRAAQSGAALESRLSILAAALLGLPQRIGIFILGRDSASRLLDVVRKTLKVVGDEDTRTKLSDWLTRVQSTYEKRNGVIHSQIVHDPDNGKLYWVRLAARLEGLAWSDEEVRLDDLQSIGQGLDDLCVEFDQQITSLLIQRLPHTREPLGHPPSS